MKLSLVSLPVLLDHHQYCHNHHHELQNNIRITILVLIISCLTVATTTVPTHNDAIHFSYLMKRGPEDSYFGYSVAQHVLYDDVNDSSTFKPYILVGAPRANSSRLPGVIRPGVIYVCTFSWSSGCRQLDIESTTTITAAATSSSKKINYSARNTINTNNNTNNNERTTRQLLTRNMDLIPDDDRNDQWLGVSVKSQGPNGYAVACAHRRMIKGPGDRWGQGICYMLRRNLTLLKSWIGRPADKGHEKYGFCQIGISCDISENSVLQMGAPCIQTRRESALTRKINSTAKDGRNRYVAAVADDEAKENRHTYQGMSVVSGKFFNDKIYYATGAPRSKDVGRVLIKLSGRLGKAVELVLDGEQMGSSFGYQLATIDFNGDGRLDLAVAAPFFFNQSEGGKVYLYTNDGKTFKPSATLTGRLESRFGLALANCGDLNKDGYDDLAVGAPYDPEGGAVYIYLGSQDGIKPTSYHVLKASQMPVGFRVNTFGYSLSGGQDLDRNGYPDLIVGSYSDDLIYILRTRPFNDGFSTTVTPINSNRTA